MKQNQKGSARAEPADDLRAALERVRAQALETAALVHAAAEMASPLAPAPAVEKLQALVHAAEKSADASLAAAEALMAQIDERQEGAT